MIDEEIEILKQRAELYPEATTPEQKQLVMDLYQELMGLVSSQSRGIDDINLVKKAFEQAAIAHSSQIRRSGELYITHPLQVAIILAELEVDTQSLCAGLLHDVLEDTKITKETLEADFGKDTLSLIEGVTKLNKLSFDSLGELGEKEQQAENCRKLFLAIAADMRVVWIKLADRLHNMRTLDHLSAEKQKRIASETLEIFAPLANRFGLNYFKWRLEDLSFKYLEPDAYRRIEKMVSENRQQRETYLTTLKELIAAEITDMNIPAQITGRVKHFYSIYNKLRRINSDDIFDLLAIRIIVEKERQCYEILGIIHDLFQPIPGRFKDYVAIPKSNLYRSLHTTVIGPDKKLVEIQIRTQEMHNIAEYGIAAHWRYKESGGSVASARNYDVKLSSLRQKFLELQQDIKDATEYNQAVKIDIFADEIFIFSPKGDVFCLPE